MMSSDSIGPVLAFYRKATELESKGHIVSAAENFGRAAEAARDLATGTDDLVTVDMQRSQADVLLSYVTRELCMQISSIKAISFATSALFPGR